MTVLHDFFFFALPRLARKLWKPSGEAEHRDPEGGEWSGGNPTLLALASLYAGDANSCVSAGPSDER